MCWPVIKPAAARLKIRVWKVFQRLDGVEWSCGLGGRCGLPSKRRIWCLNTRCRGVCSHLRCSAGCEAKIIPLTRSFLSHWLATFSVDATGVLVQSKCLPRCELFLIIAAKSMCLTFFEFLTCVLTGWVVEDCLAGSRACASVDPDHISKVTSMSIGGSKIFTRKWSKGLNIFEFWSTYVLQREWCIFKTLSITIPYHCRLQTDKRNTVVRQCEPKSTSTTYNCLGTPHISVLTGNKALRYHYTTCDVEPTFCTSY